MIPIKKRLTNLVADFGHDWQTLKLSSTDLRAGIFFRALHLGKLLAIKLSWFDAGPGSPVLARHHPMVLPAKDLEDRTYWVEISKDLQDGGPNVDQWYVATEAVQKWMWRSISACMEPHSRSIQYVCRTCGAMTDAVIENGREPATPTCNHGL